ncbi:MAG: class I SAM-dependent methyltransferase, partial [Thermoproteota archaeon]|nr:class I SAM-dependent methyltransferase [Thermoproteota archaeon]
MEKPSYDFARLWGYSVGFYGVWIAHIGRQMRLFDHIATRPMSMEELIGTTKFYPTAVRAWCIAAQSYRFIITKQGKLHLKNQMKHMLIDKSSKDYVGGQFSYLALRSLEYTAFEKLFKFGRTTKMSNSLDAVQQATDWDHYAFLATARDNKKLYGLLSRGCWLLDVGCGTGSMISKLQTQYPRSTFVGIDPSIKAILSARKI